MADIVCKNCGGRQLETTDRYRSNIPSHGGMFRLKPLFVTWQCFPFHSGMTRADLECPDCGGLLGGKVKAEGEWCEECGKEIIDGHHECGELSEMDRLLMEYEPEPPAQEDLGVDQGVDDAVMRMHGEGKKPGEIGKALGIHHNKVAAIVKRIIA
jgi:hypothetical protein